MVGTWVYRHPRHGLVVGEFAVSRTDTGQLEVLESISRDGLCLSGTLHRSDDGWYTAQLQHGYSTRLRQEEPDKITSQFCEPNGQWETVIVSERRRAQSRLRMAAILVVSLAVSAACSSAVFGWQMGLGMILHLLVHEYGHVLAMRYYQVPLGAIVFVPFVGAAVRMQSMPKSARQEAMIALAGPYLGSIGTLGCLAAIAGGAEAKIWMTLTKFGVYLNLGNLLPVGVLDGGRVAPMLSSWAMPIGLVASASMLAANVQPGFAMAFAATCAYRTWVPLPEGRRLQRPEGFFEQLTDKDRAEISLAYLGLAGFLFVTMHTNDRWFRQMFPRETPPEQTACREETPSEYGSKTSPEQRSRGEESEAVPEESPTEYGSESSPEQKSRGEESETVSKESPTEYGSETSPEQTPSGEEDFRRA